MKSKLEKVMYMSFGALIAFIGYMFGSINNVSVTADSKSLSRAEFENLLDKRISGEGDSKSLSRAEFENLLDKQLSKDGWKPEALKDGIKKQPQTKDSVVDEIVVRKLRVVDAQGNTVAVLGKQSFSSDESSILEVYDMEGDTVLSLAQDSDGGRIAVVGKEKRLVGLNIDDAGGRISVFGKGGGVANLHIDDGAGGAVAVFGEDGKGSVGLRINDAGGLVSVLGKRQGK